MNEKTPLIYDGDMGGDDLWALSVLLAHQDKFDLMGIATCYGNVSQPYATDNLLNFLNWLGKQNKIEVAKGADSPCDGMRPFGDDAYGENGVGGVSFPETSQKPVKGDVTDWYAQKLDDAQEPVTIFCTGPATNIANLLQKHPDKAEKISEFIFMGGALNPPGKDGKPVFLENDQQRIGNITLYAEFNAFQDPRALNIIMQSGVKTTIVSADATQNIVYTPERQAAMQAMDETYGPAFHRMLIVVEQLDRTKFGVDGSFVHDPSAAVYLVKNDLFESVKINGLHFDESSPYPMETTKRGQALISDEFKTTANWVSGVKNEADVYNLIKTSIKLTVSQVSESPKPPVI